MTILQMRDQLNMLIQFGYGANELVVCTPEINYLAIDDLKTLSNTSIQMRTHIHELDDDKEYMKERARATEMIQMRRAKSAYNVYANDADYPGILVDDELHRLD